MSNPTLWLSPWAQQPFSASMPWRTQRITTNGHFDLTEATRTAGDILGLSPRSDARGARRRSRCRALARADRAIEVLP